MEVEEHSFYSDGLRLSGKLFFGDGGSSPDAPQPLLVPCSGFTGLMDFHPARFARRLTRGGLTCFAFDYRGFGGSEGTPGHVILEEQVRDLSHAVAYAASDERIDSECIFLLGWGMGAGLIVDAGRFLPGIRGLVCVNGFYSGRRLYEAHRSPEQMDELWRAIREERRKRARTGERTWVDPFSFYMLDETSEGYVDAVLRHAPGFNGGRYSFELADSLANWKPDVYAQEFRLPLLIAHGTENRLHTVEEAWRLYHLRGPKGAPLARGRRAHRVDARRSPDLPRLVRADPRLGRSPAPGDRPARPAGHRRGLGACGAGRPAGIGASARSGAINERR
jgi:pimeloyl-ACP methyl ester carboxylesterase